MPSVDWLIEPLCGWLQVILVLSLLPPADRRLGTKTTPIPLADGTNFHLGYSLSPFLGYYSSGANIGSQAGRMMGC